MASQSLQVTKHLCLSLHYQNKKNSGYKKSATLTNSWLSWLKEQQVDVYEDEKQAVTNICFIK